ncbi:MAG: hypothetical protein DVB31_02975 [Verrucomicrobia bacterium]|nr:MAG: hypothetical protein DVB31_02975 [Verrucomicrobiota bacterium]
MIPRINSLVLLAHLPDWSTAPKVERRWLTRIASAVAGNEDRGALRQTPLQVLSWQVVPFDSQERALLDDRLRAALLDGQAATPWWGRALRLGGLLPAPRWSSMAPCRQHGCRMPAAMCSFARIRGPRPAARDGKSPR